MKKSTFCFFLGCFILSGIGTYAQDFAIGVRGGLSIPNLTAGGNQNPINTGYSSRLGPDAGIFAEFKFSNLFSIEPMAEYSSQGGKKDGLQALSTPAAFADMFPPGQSPQYLYARYNSEAKMNYLMIPVLAKFGWNLKKSPLRFYAGAGPFVSFLLNAHQVTTGESPFYLDPSGKQALPAGEQSFNNTQNIKDQLHAGNFGVSGNLGFNYHFGKNSVFIEGGGNYGFINIQKGAKNGDNNTGAATADIGYVFWFGNAAKPKQK